MYTNYSEIRSLYHHGIKGQKWGVRKEDPPEVKKAAIKSETAIQLGKEQTKQVFMQEKTLRKESRNELRAKEKKYITIGASVVIGILALKRVAQKGWRKAPKIAAAKVAHSDVVDSLIIQNNILLDNIDESLYHHGIKDMKWGIRRFQNKDGTLTEEGRIRYYGTDAQIRKRVDAEIEKELNKVRSSKDFKKLSEEEQQNRIREATTRAEDYAMNALHDLAQARAKKEEAEWAIEKVKAGQSITNDISRTLYDSTKLIKNVPGKSEHPDYSDISTDELIKRTNRLNAEYNYAKATGQIIYTPSKQEVTRERLQTMAAVTALIGSVGGIALTLKNLKNFGTAGGGKG